MQLKFYTRKSICIHYYTENIYKNNYLSYSCHLYKNKLLMFKHKNHTYAVKPLRPAEAFARSTRITLNLTVLESGRHSPTVTESPSLTRKAGER